MTAPRGVGGAVLVALLAVCGCGDGGGAAGDAHGAKTATTASAAAVRIGRDDLASCVGETVLIGGTAVTARAGAAVTFADGTPIYVSGLSAWGARFEGRQVEVRGVLRRRASRVPGGGEPSGGPGETYALDRARWKLRASAS